MSGEPPVVALDNDVELWRRHILRAAGYGVEDARLLALDPTVDLHQAVELLEHGCTVETALLILL